MTAAVIFFVAWVLTMALLVIALCANEINKATATNLRADNTDLRADLRALRPVTPDQIDDEVADFAIDIEVASELGWGR